MIGFSFWDTKITPALPLNYWLNGCVLWQDVYFLWFPYWFKADSAWLNGYYPFPFVKGWILSAFNMKEKHFFIDAHNNSWFSGWPVIFLRTWEKDLSIGWVIHWFISDVQTNENSWIALAYNIDPIIEAISLLNT